MEDTKALEQKVAELEKKKNRGNIDNDKRTKRKKIH